MIKFAIGNDYLDKDPFLLYRAKTVKKEVIFLTQEELNNLDIKVFELKDYKL